MPTAVEELQSTLTDINALHDKGRLEGNDVTTMQGLLAKGQQLRSQIQALRSADEFIQAGNQSAGMLPLATAGDPAAAQVVATRAAGAVDFHNQNDQEIIAHNYGEGLYSARTFSAIRKPEYRDAFRSYVRGFAKRGEGAMTAASWRILEEGSDSDGGYLVPEDLQSKIIARQPAPLSVMSRVTKVMTNRDSMVFPRFPYDTDDLYTTPIRVTWVDEVIDDSTVSRTTPPSFGTFRIPIYTAMASLPITKSLIEDESFGLVAWIQEKMGESVDITQEIVTIAGNGQGQPMGILASPGAKNQVSVINTGDATALGADRDTIVDNLTTVAFDLPPQYDQNGVWVFNKKSTGLTIAKLRDDTGRPLWGAGLQESGLEMGFVGRPLIGYPTLFSPFMPDIGANKFPIVFGDLKAYYFANRVGFSIQVLTEKYAEQDQVVILGRFRMGGATGEPWRLRTVKCST